MKNSSSIFGLLLLILASTIIELVGRNTSITPHDMCFEAKHGAPLVICQDVILEANDNSDIDQDGDVCEIQEDVYVVAQGLNVNDECSGKRLFWVVHVDYWYDGIIDEIYSSFISESDPYYLNPTENELDQTIKLNKEFLGGEWSRHVVEWKVFDACENVSQCHQYIEVADRRAPDLLTLEMAYIDYYSDPSIELQARSFVTEISDNCISDELVRITFSEVPPIFDLIDEEHCFKPVFDDRDNCVPLYDPETGQIVSEYTNCNKYEEGARRSDCQIDGVQKWNPVAMDIDGQLFNTSSMVFKGGSWCSTIPIKISAWDRKYNKGLDTVDVLFVGTGCHIEQTPLMYGNIVSVNEEPIPGVSVLNRNELYEQNTTSSDNGYYQFSFNLLNFVYIITPKKEGDWLEGVNVRDLFVLKSYLDGTREFTSPYKKVAADINFDQQINVDDLKELSAIILGNSLIEDEFDAWKFIDKKQALELESPWPLADSVKVQNFVDHVSNIDFYGVKIGDLDDADVQSNQKTFDQHISKQSIELGYRVYEYGTSIIANDQIRNLKGFQFELEFSGDFDKLIDSDFNKNELIYVKHDNNNRATFICILEEMKNYTKGEVLFSLAAINNLVIATDRIEAKVFFGNQLESGNLLLRNNEKGNSELILQNTPNPFDEETIFSLKSSVERLCKVNIYNTAGELVHDLEIDLQVGENNFKVSRHDIGNAGLYICQVLIDDSLHTKKILLH